MHRRPGGIRVLGPGRVITKNTNANKLSELASELPQGICFTSKSSKTWGSHNPYMVALVLLQSTPGEFPPHKYALCLITPPSDLGIGTNNISHFYVPK